MSEDPVFGDPSRPNTLLAFGYADGNPLTFTDPLGERAMTEEEAARDAEWFADYQRRNKAWDELPWYKKVADFFSWTGNEKGAAILARNILNYRGAIERAADGEAVVMYDVGAEYGTAPVTLKLPSGEQTLSVNPLVMPASQVDRIMWERERNAQTLQAMTSGPAASVSYVIADAAGASEDTKSKVAVTVAAAEQTFYAARGFGAERGAAGRAAVETATPKGLPPVAVPESQQAGREVAPASEPRVLRMPKAVGADVYRVRVRHYTRKSSLQGIREAGVLRAGDKGSVFTVPAKGKPGGPRDVEEALGIKPGKGGAFVEFDSRPGEFKEVINPKTGAREFVFRGDVDLADRNPSFEVNR